jgi:exopolyphosphatase / guanosine-5'-triphosphate,3'-diphosphate pyrophosphatase
MTNYAAVDCGTLSTRLLISGPGGEPVVRLTRVTGLGQGVDQARELRADAIERVLSVLREYRGLMGTYGVGAARMVGTSALRDALNRSSFSRAAEAVVGTPLCLLSGAEEAALSFLGATNELGSEGAPWLVADIGGGSTELVVGPKPSGARSLDLGSVRVTERFLHNDPATDVQLTEASSWLREQYLRAEQDEPGLRSAQTLVGLAGTVVALARYDQGLPSSEHDAVHHYRLSSVAVDTALAEMAVLPEGERARLPGIEPARAPVIVGGALVLATLMEHFGFDECLVSESDILDGVIISLVRLDKGPTWRK